MSGRLGNTFNSHRLIDYAYRIGGGKLQDEVVIAIMSGYNEKGGDITSIDFLVDIAEGAGINGKDFREYLKTDKNCDLIRKEEQYWRNLY